MAAIAGDRPFIMKPDGLDWLVAPRCGQGRAAADAYYEPVESLILLQALAFCSLCNSPGRSPCTFRYSR